MTRLLPDRLEALAGELFESDIPDLVARRRSYAVDASDVDESLLALFSEHISASAVSLRAAVQQGAVQDIRREAHSLQGMGGTIGVPSLSVVGEILSESAKAGNLARCKLLSGRLDKWVEAWRMMNERSP